MIKLKNESGSISVIVIVTLLFFLTIVSAVYMINSTMNKSQLKSEENMKNTYESEFNNIDDIYANLLKKWKIADVKGKAILSTTDNISLRDDNNNIVIVPAGFKVASDSSTDVSTGVVIEDANGNQFVWVPVTTISDYTRTDYGKQNGSYSDYSETIPTDEQTSVTTYHGYYIGRYEAGDSVSTTSKILRTSGASTTNALSIKKGQVPYNFVTRDQAKTLAEGMKTAQGYTAKTKLCSSYAWDSAINFIQKVAASYGTTSSQGNYNDTTFSYTDITGTSQTKALSSAVLIPTGQTIPVSNVYDMGGNDYEWTTETNSNSSYPCVYRGGQYSNNYADGPAGYRSYDSTSNSFGSIGFRITLYL